MGARGGLFDYPDNGLSEAAGRLQFLADRSEREHGDQHDCRRQSRCHVHLR